MEKPRNVWCVFYIFPVQEPAERWSFGSSAISSTQMWGGFTTVLAIRASSRCTLISKSNSYNCLIFFVWFRMKPTRIRMCHSLVMNYGLYKRMEIFVSTQPYLSQYYCLLTLLLCFNLACKTRYQTRDDPVSFRRIRWLPKPYYAEQYESVHQRAT